MGAKSKIGWCEATWNPFTGCTEISPGCANCYAKRETAHLKRMGTAKYSRGWEFTVHPEVMDHPLRWKRPRRIFVNSMSDTFHEKAPYSAIASLFQVMVDAKQHTFQVLTKRGAELLNYAPLLNWAPNIWVGVTIESSNYLHRLEALSEVPAAIKFVSFEPLLSGIPVTVDLTGIDWAIVGGESGPWARPMDPEWVRGIQRMCQRDGVAFYFKQWGGRGRDKGGRVLDGRTWDEMPEGYHREADHG